MVYEDRRSGDWRLGAIEDNLRELKQMIQELAKSVNEDRLHLMKDYVSREEHQLTLSQMTQRIERLWSLFWAMVVLLIATMGTLIGRMIQGI